MDQSETDIEDLIEKYGLHQVLASLTSVCHDKGGLYEKFSKQLENITEAWFREYFCGGKEAIRFFEQVMVKRPKTYQEIMGIAAVQDPPFAEPDVMGFLAALQAAGAIDMPSLEGDVFVEWVRKWLFSEGGEKLAEMKGMIQ